MGISGIPAIPMIITCLLQGTLCDTGIPRTFYGGKICSVQYVLLTNKALLFFISLIKSKCLQIFISLQIYFPIIYQIQNHCGPNVSESYYCNNIKAMYCQTKSAVLSLLTSIQQSSPFYNSTSNWLLLLNPKENE